MDHTRILSAALLLVLAACGPAETPDGVPVRERTETESTVVDATPERVAEVAVHYEHQRTCARFLGREGRYYVVRVVGIVNRRAEPFAFHPDRLRFPGGGAPALLVPEFSDAEAPSGATLPVDELYLVEEPAAPPPPQGPVSLAYAEDGVRLVREGALPAYDAGTGCDDLNT